MGTEADDFVQLTQRIGRTTGGIRTRTLISPRHEPAGLVAKVFVSGKCLAGQVPAMLDLMRDMILTTKLDDKVCPTNS